MTAEATPAGKRQPRSLRKIGYAILALMLGFAGTMLVDRALGLFGWPDRVRPFPVAPPHFERTVERPEYRYTIRTNDRGIRYRTVPLHKPAGTVRVVALGDSFVEGACVEVEQRWSNLIEHDADERGLGPLQVIDCGEAGTGPVDYARTLAQVGFDYEPDAVLIGIYTDDVPATPPNVDPQALLVLPPEPVGPMGEIGALLWPHLAAMTTVAKMQPRHAEREPAVTDVLAQARAHVGKNGVTLQDFRRWRKSVPDSVIDDIAHRRIAPGLVTYALTRPTFFREGIGIEGGAAVQRFHAMCRVLGAMVAACQQHGAKVGVVLMPSVFQYDPASSQRLTARVYASQGHPMRPEWLTEITPLQQHMSAWAKAQKVPLLDLVPVFRRAVAETEEPLNWAIDPHWTPAGHRVAATAIEAWLLRSGLIPGRPRH